MMLSQQNVKGKKVTVLGAARSGRAVADLLARQGADILLSDHGSVEACLPDWCQHRGIKLEANGHTDAVLNADFLVLSPGVPTSVPQVQATLNAGVPVYSELEVASWYTKGRVVAITGTNGKTTTAKLMGHMLNMADRPAIVAGNIGTPLSEHIQNLEANTVVVLEVSSFQLDHVETFQPDVSIILNITPDHLDRYCGSFERYASSKLRIYQNQTDPNVVIYNHDDSLVREHVEYFLSTSDVQGAPFSRKVELTSGASAVNEWIRLQGRALIPTNELGIPGPHNVSNSLAAALAGQALGLTDQMLRRSLKAFTGVNHRLEVVRQLDGVTYINDSKATNVDALGSALRSFSEPILLLAGGRDKGNDYDQVKSLVTEKVHTVIAFGESAPKMMRELGPHCNHSIAVKELSEATQQARQYAQAGDIVLLSPACSSFDMFSNFEERGESFRQIVETF